MFLTRMQLNPQRRGARKLLSSRYALHAAVCSGFPELSDAPANGRVLWRLDRYEQRTLLYVVSPGRPDFTHLAEQAGWPTLQGWETRDYSVLLRTISEGQRWAFRLTANPVHRTRQHGRAERGKPQGHVTAAHQEKWLLDRTEAAGFAVAGSTSEDSGVKVSERSTARFRGRSGEITLRIATFEGILLVTDVERIRHVLTHGLGRAKGFGCGLLTLAPAH